MNLWGGEVHPRRSFASLEDDGEEGALRSILTEPPSDEGGGAVGDGGRE